MNLRKAIRGFNTLYGRKKKIVMASGEWTGAPELGMEASELREKAKKAGMTLSQYRKYMEKKKKSDSAGIAYSSNSNNYWRGQ